ncbi:MAG: hypothetical protein E5V85_11055 [Mesorhizobium sp.]|nr:MAG: hypothetical protein E5V85_11055 [Mesorhizobium sp.]
MYTLTARIFAIVADPKLSSKLAQLGSSVGKKSQNPPKTTPKRAILRGIGPIVTLWQQWGRNFPFTSKLTLRNACFRGNEAPLSGS